MQIPSQFKYFCGHSVPTAEAVQKNYFVICKEGGMGL